MTNNINKKEHNPIFKIIILIGLVLLAVINFKAVISIFARIYGIVAPLLLGCLMAFVLNILVKEYEKKYFYKSKNKAIIKSRRGVCIVLSILTVMLIVFFFLRIVIPQISKFISLLIESFPVFYDRVYEWAMQYADEFPILQQKIQEFSADGTQVLNKGLKLAGDWAYGTFSLIGTVFGIIIEFILALTFSIYILFSKEDLKNKFNKLFCAFINKDRRQKIYYVLNTANETFSNYIIGQCKEAIILGTLCTLGMLIFRFPYATIVGPVMGITALIPVVGAYIGAILGFLLIVIIDPVKSVLFLLFIVVLQQFEGNVIYPKVVGKSIGLPGIWVFAAVTIGGSLMGIPGVLFGVPLAATVYKLLGKIVNERLKIKK